MAGNEKIKDLVDRINDLPLLDAATLDLIHLLDDPESNFNQIIDKLTPDAMAMFLQVANAAYYGVNVKTIDHALRILGYDAMKQILITSLIINHFSSSPHLRRFKFSKFDKTARFCSTVSKVLGDIVQYKKVEDLFTVSILHNIGKMIIVGYFNEDYQQVVALKNSEGITESEAEKRVLGLDHAEIGGMVLENFRIPQEICNAVKHHNLENYEIKDNTNYELEMILRESATLISDFEPPEVEESFKLLDQMRETIDKGKGLYRRLVKSEMREKGHKEIFPSVLKQVSELVHDDLKSILPEQT